jgi:hypothetical protein
MHEILYSFLVIFTQRFQLSQGAQAYVSLLASFIPFLIMFCMSNKKYSKHDFWLFKPKASIVLIGSIINSSFRTRKQYSKRFLSVLHYIHTELDDKQHTKVKRLVEICGMEVDEVLSSDDKQDEELLIDQDETLNLGNGIYCKFSIQYNDIPEDQVKMHVTNITCNLLTYRNDIIHLKAFVNDCITKYDAYLKSKLEQNLYLFAYDTEDDMEIFKKVVFKSNKTFDNVFFKQKEPLIERVEFFEKQKHLYEQFGIPHTFGILMHGAPGTGKTSTIKALANHTKRHIISIPLHKVQNISTLSKLFLKEDIDGVNVPFDKRIYVFEEIDCNGMKDVVKARNNGEGKISDSFDDIQSIMICAKKNELAPKPRAITLGGILELLDGLMETPGRIIIITTNHPSELDPALIRPGRIDMNIEFDKAQHEDIKAMYKLWYGKELEDLVGIEEGKHTHAEVCQAFFSCAHDPQKGISLLK